ncbi:winged helix-turn-helix transcriptional regulator [Herbaspirillum sp. GCM10030257]|uniref:winged helix-turn-helix transcriptional regulator n=1 Tax=Herbaspirillum sp. GCM10030257 TaxID=3273393 RepID=UPI00360D3971
MTLPVPGKPVRGSSTGRPVMALLDMLGQRWVLRILWELRSTALTFRELREHCDAMSPTVLNQRLRELRDAGVVVLEDPGGYALSASGKELLDALMPLQHWAEQWQERMAAQSSAADSEQSPVRRKRATCD